MKGEEVVDALVHGERCVACRRLCADGPMCEECEEARRPSPYLIGMVQFTARIYGLPDPTRKGRQ